MNNVFSNKEIQLAKLCKIYNVEALSVFGSATNSSFKNTSDIDLLVRFSNDIALLNYANNYFDLLEELTLLFERKIDLVSERSLKNPVFIKEVKKTQISLFEA
ncbi:MAG: nucleotidyltransferase domain-containing protein [Fluviicola sp.]|nr:nucleotidyltransferase domain-containing protein [Fluviicola sp.]